MKKIVIGAACVCWCINTTVLGEPTNAQKSRESSHMKSAIQKNTPAQKAAPTKTPAQQAYVQHLTRQAAMASAHIEGTHPHEFYTSKAANAWHVQVQKKAVKTATNMPIKPVENPTPWQIFQDLKEVTTRNHPELTVIPLITPDGEPDNINWDAFRGMAARRDLDRWSVYVVYPGQKTALISRTKNGPQLRGVLRTSEQFDPQQPTSKTKLPTTAKESRMEFLRKTTAPDAQSANNNFVRLALIAPTLKAKILLKQIDYAHTRETYMQKHSKKTPHA